MQFSEVTFEQVWVISLKARPDRLRRFFAQIDSVDWPFARPQAFWGIDAARVGLPAHWRGGPQDYGIHRSHVNLLERAIQEDVRSVLIMEDTVILKPDAPQILRAFLGQVPTDWECLMLAGFPSDGARTETHDNRLLDSLGIRQTQFYGLQGRNAMCQLYKYWSGAQIDGNFLLNSFLCGRQTYSPRFACIDHVISKNWQKSRQFRLSIRNPTGFEPVILLDAPREVFEEMQTRGWHGGYRREPETGFDIGLAAIFQNSGLDPVARSNEILSWINMIQLEAISVPNGICTIWHPNVKAEMIRPLLRGHVYEIRANTPSEAVAQLPASLYPGHTLDF